MINPILLLQCKEVPAKTQLYVAERKHLETLKADKLERPDKVD